MISLTFSNAEFKQLQDALDPLAHLSVMRSVINRLGRQATEDVKRGMISRYNFKGVIRRADVWTRASRGRDLAYRAFGEFRRLPLIRFSGLKRSGKNLQVEIKRGSRRTVPNAFLSRDPSAAYKRRNGGKNKAMVGMSMWSMFNGIAKPEGGDVWQASINRDIERVYKTEMLKLAKKGLKVS